MHFDLVFKDATVIDGTNAPRFRADVAVAGGIITQIASAISSRADRRVNASGLVLCPGFIDVHTHDDALMLTRAQQGEYHPKLSQGVTTVLTGNCGVSLAPLQTLHVPAPLDILGVQHYRYGDFGLYFHALESIGPVCNVASLVGHTTLRVKHMKALDRSATLGEQVAMQKDVRAALRTGAWGVSSGVYYPPARAASEDELIALGEAVAEADGVYAMHLRDEADAIDSAIDEALRVGERTGARLVFSHHKVLGLRNAGRATETLHRIESAAARTPVCLDCYPYNASSTMLLPERIAQSRDVLITWSTPDASASGRSLFELASERGQSPEQCARSLQPAGAIYFAMDERDVCNILAHPMTVIGSDGLAQDSSPHPRLWGTFPRVLGHYSLREKLFPLETAVHKMTGLPAQRFGFSTPHGETPGRGVIRVGMAADVVLFDPTTILDQATFKHPQLPASGIKRVYVNGGLTVLDGMTVTQRGTGLVLRRSVKPASN